MENQINGLENGLKRSKNVTINFGNQIYCDPNLLALR